MLLRPVKTYQRKATLQSVVSLPIFQTPSIINPDTSSDFDNSDKHGNNPFESTFDRIAKDVKLPPPPPPPGPDESIYNASSSFENHSDVDGLDEIPIVNPKIAKPSRGQKRKKKIESEEDDEDDVPLLMRKKNPMKVKREVKNARKKVTNNHQKRINKRQKTNKLEYEGLNNIGDQFVEKKKIPPSVDQLKNCIIELKRLRNKNSGKQTFIREEVNHSEIQHEIYNPVEVDSVVISEDPSNVEMAVDAKELDETEESLSDTGNILKNLSISSLSILSDKTNSHSPIPDNILKKCSVDLVRLSLNGEFIKKETAITSSNEKGNIENSIPKSDETVPNHKINHVNTNGRGKSNKKKCCVALTRFDAIEKFPDEKKGRRGSQKYRNDSTFISSTPLNSRIFPSRPKLSPINNNFIVFDTTTKTINSTNSIEVVDPSQLETEIFGINQQPPLELLPVLKKLENFLPKKEDEKFLERVTGESTEDAEKRKTHEKEEQFLTTIENSIDALPGISGSLDDTVPIFPPVKYNPDVEIIKLNDTDITVLNSTDIDDEVENKALSERLSMSTDRNRSRSLFDDTVRATSAVRCSGVEHKEPSRSQSESMESIESMEALKVDDPTPEADSIALVNNLENNDEDDDNDEEEKQSTSGEEEGEKSNVKEERQTRIGIDSTTESKNEESRLDETNSQVSSTEDGKSLANGSCHQFPTESNINQTDPMETDEDMTNGTRDNDSVSLSLSEINQSESNIFADSIEMNEETTGDIEKDDSVSLPDKIDNSVLLNESTPMKTKIISEPYILLKRLNDPVRITNRRGEYVRSRKFELSAISESMNTTESVTKPDTKKSTGVVDRIEANENQELIEEENESIQESKLPNEKTEIDKRVVFLKPGKHWARSLSILNHIQSDRDIDKMSIGKGKNWRQSVMNVLNMQEPGVIDLFDSVRNGIDENPNENMNFQKRKTSVMSRRKTSVYDPRCTNINSNTIIPNSLEEARSVVLERCGQKDGLKFSDCYPDSFLKHCRKIGEGVYGEVFLYDEKGESSVIKIIPIEGSQLVNGEPQKKFSEILSEIIIAEELHNLRVNATNRTSGFVEVKSIKCLQGKYPKKLIDLWTAYDEEKKSENDCPSMFNDEQMYISLELGNGGQDLEAYVFQNATEAFSTFIQTALTLAVGEKSLNFEHRDMHWGNVLISKTKDDVMSYKLDSEDYEYPCQGIKVSVIDFTLSRISYQGCCMYNDLALDPSLFTAVGEYQFDVYRLMRDKLNNDWKEYQPYTNVLWLHYTLDKMITAARYKRSNTKIHKRAIEKLQGLKDEILEYESAFDFVTNCESVTGLTRTSVESP